VTQKAQAPLANPFVTFTPRRAERSSRATARRVVPLRKATTRRLVRSARAARHRSVVRKTHRIASVRATENRRHKQSVRSRNTTVARRDSARVQPPRRRHRYPGKRTGKGMSAVLAYARSQVGKRYVSGGEGPYSFDCSGFTRSAYARAGLHLPHSSGAQAAWARPISAGAARPGDLVVGPGHVGVYMGGGMMIDAGNPRTGVVYRPLYDGLRIERFEK